MDKKWFRRNWHWVVFVGVAVISFLVWLGWEHGIAVSFAVLSIFVATFFASRSLKITRDSLELTRTTTRPFLNITGGIYEGGIQRMQLRIENTGLLPADDISLEIETIEPKNIVSSSVSLIDFSVSIFPKEYKTELIEMNPKFSAEINSGAEYKALIKITYHFLGKVCHTNRMLHLPPSPAGRQDQEQLDFLSEGNYWD